MISVVHCCWNDMGKEVWTANRTADAFAPLPGQTAGPRALNYARPPAPLPLPSYSRSQMIA